MHMCTVHFTFALASRWSEIIQPGMNNPCKNTATERSGPQPGTEFIFELPAKFGVGNLKLGVPEHIYPEVKGQCLFLLKMANHSHLTCHRRASAVYLQMYTEARRRHLSQCIASGRSRSIQFERAWRRRDEAAGVRFAKLCEGYLRQVKKNKFHHLESQNKLT